MNVFIFVRVHFLIVWSNVIMIKTASVNACEKRHNALNVSSLIAFIPSLNFFVFRDITFFGIKYKPDTFKTVHVEPNAVMDVMVATTLFARIRSWS